MSINSDENLPSIDSPEPESPTSLLKDEPMEAIHFSPSSIHVTAEADLINKQYDTKTIDFSDNDITEDEQLNTKRRSELKLLLALSKEANLETNISYKRKSLDPVKLKEMTSTPPKSSSETEQLAKKARIVEKTDKFPITAESELESMVVGESSNNDDMPTPEKLKKEEPKVKDGGVGDERKNIKDFKMFKPNKDIFCWRCHREGVNICCETCPRSYHQKCLKQTISNVENWPCPECVAILKAESTQTRSPAMKGMTLEHLCSLLKFAVKRMIECNGSEPFLHPVNDKDFPEYKKYIIQPMNLTLLEKNIKENLYGSTQAFEADAKWILHNSIIFNSYQSKLTTFAKTIMKICKQEMAEIENCPSCYLNANTKKSTWFVEVCPKPHILVWAKLKGFPYWPAKAMCVNSSGMVDVRFFGAHDRAWVPSKECFLYSRRDPNSNKQKRNDIIECMREVEVYISNIKALYGEFNYAPFKLPYDPENELKQLLLFIPRFKPNAPPPKKRCRLSESRSKSSVKKDEVDVKDENEPEAKETNKESMEGYGTDDEMNDSTVDTNKRTMMLRRHADSNLSKEIEDEEEEEEASEDSDSEEEESEDKIDPEVDDDTQVSSNSPTETLLRGNVRTRGGLNASIGKIKIIPRKISEESSPRKRLSSDETYSPSKTSRRNSDQSVKSDSSRLSSLSDKINRVDMSENVELTLGNSSESYITSSTNDTETKKKPVQIDVELSISPQNKVKITDRIMKKLSSSDEDISKSSPNKENEVKSQTDIILERYKNLVKKKSKEFASVEASTSFGSTSISSKDLCESSSNIDGITSEEKVKTDSKESDKDIECTYKNDEGKASISQKIESSNELVISSTENISPPEEMEEISKPEARRISAENPHDSSTEDEDDEKAKDTTKRDSTSETRVNTDILDGAVTTNVISETIPEKIMSSNIHAPEKEKEEISSNCEDEEVDETHCKKEGNSPIKCKLGAVISAKILQSKMKEKPEQEVISKSEGKDEINSATETKSRTQNIVEKSLTTTGKNDGETDCISITHTNSEVVGNSTETEPSDSVVKIAISKKDKKFQVKEITSTKIKILPKEVTLEKIEPESKKRDKEEFVDNKSAKAIEHTDSNSSDDQDVVLDDTQIDETNIRNIIHSSLNRVGGLKRPIEETTNDKKSIERNEDGTTETSKEPQDTQIQKKPRTHDEENEKLSISQNFKIVPIQAILNKSTDTVSTDQSLIMNNPILLKKLSQKDSETNVSNEQGMVCVEIKSEPESSDEEAEESEYMEKKRKYMSALNISEKTDEVSAPKKHVIRTRSKAEVMESIRQIDNLSRVIEEVATTFSAKHEAKKTNDRKITNQPPSNSQMLEEKKRASVQENGEIYVKSFAKLPQQQTISRVIQARPLQKSKSSSFAVKTNPQPIRKETPQKTEMAPTTLTRIVSTPNVTTTNSQNPPVPVSVANKPIDSLSSPGNVLILTQPGVILPTSQQLTYNAGSFVTFVPSQQNMAMLQTPQVINAMMASGMTQNDSMANSRPTVELHRSQNYIPQNEEGSASKTVIQRPTHNTPSAANTSTTSQTSNSHLEVPALIPINENPNGSTAASSGVRESGTEATDDEFSLLHSMVPESVSRAISEVLCRPPPKLRPRPPGPLSQVFDSGNPSSAGSISAKINSISHRLGDYFRGMLIEMLDDLGKSNNPEATISSLRHEIESLHHRHAAEMMDIRKNVCTILKDIQGSIAEEREKLIDETRSACELEALRRIEEAKSKQWCANCGKEAQFYCCWNTSYCDYPCQQKHWTKHMGKCTQHAGQPQPVQTPNIRPQSQITFRPATPKTFTGRLLGKPTKVYLNRSTNPKNVPTFKSTSGGHLTLVDPANLEFLTSTSGAKFIASTSLFTKVKSVNSTVTSPSNGTQQPVILNQKLNSAVQILKPSPSTSNNASNVISDEEFESE